MRKIFKIGFWIIGLLAIILIVLIYKSPYGKSVGYNYKLLKHTVKIYTPADSVFRFLGNSDNAKRWSVFVHHIIPLNADSIRDGQPGSRRRCFCKANETGTLWDETILEVQQNLKRQISCYSFQGFPMTVHGIATEQIYERVNDSICNLTFTLFIKDRKPTLFESFKLYVGSYKVHSIFKQNMENVKAICEGKPVLYSSE